ncbi:hypothetical protein RhiirA4_400377 [Rhizophagus irregularis]|uniref:Uncharacterized protein n=1 Tax=Rhizophagus irregularis TaxID=588596 RepID=A0A2I1GDX2_9GLOM|nr:hypothetical protein RhiirA4_400377 [Rhizophagus irregularis]
MSLKDSKLLLRIQLLTRIRYDFVLMKPCKRVLFLITRTPHSLRSKGYQMSMICYSAHL